MKTLLFVVIIILVTTIAKAQQFQYTEITIKKYQPKGSFIGYRIDTDHTLTFYVTYIFTNDLDQTYIYQRDKEHSDSDNDNNNQDIKGLIPGKLKHITIITHCYIRGARKKRVVDLTDEVTETIPIPDDKLNGELKDLETHCYNITSGHPRYQIYKALCDIDYKVYEIKTIDQGHDISLCPNSEIRFTSDIPDFYTDKFNIYCNSHLINSKNSTTPTETYKSVNVESFFQYISGTNEPFNLTIEGVFKKDDNDFNDFYKEFYEGEYISDEYAEELTEELKKAGFNFDWDDLMDKFRQLNLEGYGVDWNQVILSLEGIFTQQKSTDIYRSFHFNGINDNVTFEKPYILDDHLEIPNPTNSPNKDCIFTLRGVSTTQSFSGEKNNIPGGVYDLQIEDINQKKCQVNLKTYVPEIKYNYLNKDDDYPVKYTHWYDNDYNKGITINIFSEEKPDEKLYALNHKYAENSNHKDVSYNSSTDPGQTTQHYKDNRRDYETSLYYTQYDIECYPDLDSIIIIPNDIEHSIYTIISTQNQGEKTGKLKAYPKIEATLVSYQDPHCNYDDAVIKIKDISGGLGLGDQDKYIFEVEDDNNIVPYKDDEGEWSISVKNHDLETISLSIFDENVKNDSGRNKRAKSFSFTVNRPQPLYIPAPSISHPLCTFDSNGSIAINTAAVQLSHDVDPIYTWSVIKGDKKNQTTTSIGLGPTISDLPAGFYQVELNNDNCIATGSYELIDPPLLEFESTTSSNAKCYGYSDGSIFTNVKGGTPGYKYSWNVGATSNNLLNIPKGKYKLTVLDAHKCQIQTDTIDISEPPQVINNNIAHDYSICQDSELEIDAGDFDDYIWKNPQGIILTPEDYNILKLNNSSPEGEYYLKTIRKDKCFAEDKINITQSKESLKMNFLLPSDIYNDDHAKIVETSSHELDSLKWTFSENLIGDFPKDSTTLTISTNALDKLSTYKIKLTGYYKGCISTVTKNLNISNLTRPEEEYIPDFYDSDEILDCRIGPNPNNGNFTLFLDLDCAKDAVLTIYSISSYKYVLREKLVGLQNYEHSINQNLQQGLYILEVKTPKSIRRIKFEVTR